MKNSSTFIIAILILAATALGTAADSDNDGAGNAIQKPQDATTAPLALTLVKHDVSPPLREIAVNPDLSKALKVSREHELPPDLNQLPEGWNGTRGVRYSPHVLQQNRSPQATMPTPTVNVTGLGVGFPNYSLSGIPPDTTGAVGANHFVQWVNTDFAFFNKDGSVVDLVGNDFRAGNALWSGFSGKCETTNDGDPVVVYDRIADRWVMSQFGLGPAAGPHSQCIAVSTTNDPTGSWYRYEYSWPSNYLNDYPKLGVWPDGYYLSVNQFQCTNWSSCNWKGAGVAVFERNQMLSGSAAQTAYWNLGNAYGALLPADLDGTTQPPVDSPGYFFAVSFTAYALQVWEVDMDWTTLANSTCGIGTEDPNATIQVTSYATTNGVAQPGTSNVLDSLSDRLMFRAAYRNFGDHESVVLCHTVANPAAMRWYEIRNPGGTPVLYQEGTYAPDTNERWMGSIAMDRVGNIAMGYSISSSTVSPSIRITGRLAGDPLGTMTFDEYEVQTGSGYQNPYYGDNRWGDYSTMSVDPEDDCSFWFTTEYIASTGQFVWRTKIAAFDLPGCIDPPDVIFEDDFELGNTAAWSLTQP